MGLAWPTLFAVPATVLPLSLVIEGADPQASVVTVTAGAADARSVQATWNATWSTWDASVLLPSKLPAGDLAVSVQVAQLDQPSLTASVIVPVANVSGVLAPTLVDVAAERVVLLPWGDGPGEVAQSGSGDEEYTYPAGFVVDDRTGDVIVLDTVNHRLVVTSATGTSEIDIPGDAVLDDVLVNGDVGSVTVIGYESGRPQRASAFIVDVAAGSVEAIGPALLPADVPFHTRFVFNPNDQVIYASINNDFYPFLDVAAKALIPALTQRSWIEASISDQDVFFVGSGTSVVGVQFPNGAGGLSELQVDAAGDVWFVASTIDSAAPEGSRVKDFATRVDPDSGAVTAVPVPGISMSGNTRLMDASDGTVYMMRADAGGIVIDRYVLP